MKTNTYHAPTRQAKKPRRRLLLASLFTVLLVALCGYWVAHFGKDTSLSSVKKDTPELAVDKNIQLAWPAVGQAAVAHVEDRVIVRSSNNETPRPTASMAKVITALAIMEKQPFELGQAGQTYTLTARDVATYHAEVARGGSVLPVYEGMILTQHEAMQMMLIASSNNIADTLVERIFGSQEAYTSYAQSMVKRMGLSQTVIADASGFSSATLSTPSDLVAIGITALKDPVIAEIVAQPHAEISDIGIIDNTNELLGVDGVIGMKTGTTDEAGSCLLFAARYTGEDGQNVTIVGVIIGSANAINLFSDSRTLLASAKQSFGVEVQPADTTVASPLRYEDRATR